MENTKIKYSNHSNRYVRRIQYHFESNIQTIIDLYVENALDYARSVAYGVEVDEPLEFYDKMSFLRQNEFYQEIIKEKTRYNRILSNYLVDLFWHVYDENLPIYKEKKKQTGKVYEEAV